MLVNSTVGDDFWSHKLPCNLYLVAIADARRFRSCVGDLFVFKACSIWFPALRNEDGDNVDLSKPTQSIRWWLDKNPPLQHVEEWCGPSRLHRVVYDTWMLWQNTWTVSLTVASSPQGLKQSAAAFKVRLELQISPISNVYSKSNSFVFINASSHVIKNCGILSLLLFDSPGQHLVVHCLFGGLRHRDMSLKKDKRKTCFTVCRVTYVTIFRHWVETPSRLPNSLNSFCSCVSDQNGKNTAFLLEDVLNVL